MTGVWAIASGGVDHQLDVVWFAGVFNDSGDFFVWLNGEVGSAPGEVGINFAASFDAALGVDGVDVVLAMGLIAIDVDTDDGGFTA